MARETKVGLLAGLAFIICFAILLANRGRQDPLAPPSSHLTDGGASVPGAVRQTDSRAAAIPQEPQRHSSSGRIAQPASSPSETSVTALDRRTLEPPATSGADLPLPDAKTVPTSPATLNPIEAGANFVHQPTERVLTSRTQDDVVRRQVLERRLGVAGAEYAATGAANLQTGASPATGLQPVQESAAKSVPYTVAPGDTLSKIALAHFGNKSRISVNAIFDANRLTLSSPDDLRAGLVLSLPVMEGMPRPAKSEPPKVSASPASKTEEAKSRPTKKTAQPPEPMYRWYQVKKNDRYTSIAREQLGDPARWRELYELNKDKFPNPQSIREGVRIKLPAVKVLALAECRR